MKALIVVLATGVVMLAQTPPPTKSAAPAAKSAAPVQKGTAPAAAPKGPVVTANPLLHPETLKAKAPESFKVKFTTTRGDFTTEVHRDWSPLGADRFYNLVKNKFFTNAAFFRIVPGFIVQFGMSADPKVTQAFEGSGGKLMDDPMKPGINNKRGTLVFAKTVAPNSRTTQLFINLGNNTGSLDPQGFSPFAEVTEGMDVISALYAGYGERPDQGRITSEGKAYLDKNFPLLDSVKMAVILPAEGVAVPAATPAKAAPTPAKSTAAPAKSTAAPAVKK